jgi:hypothetical protein
MMVERVARAISIPEHHTSWDSLSETERDLYRMQADYALKAILSTGDDAGLAERLREDARKLTLSNGMMPAFARQYLEAAAAILSLTARNKALEEALRSIADFSDGGFVFTTARAALNHQDNRQKEGG